jgi:hypothetical protein
MALAQETDVLLPDEPTDRRLNKAFGELAP